MPGRALALVIHLEVVVVVILLRQDELVPVAGVLQVLLRRRHGVVGGALLGINHAPDDQDNQDDQDDQDKDDSCELPDLFLGGQPEAGLHEPPVGVRPRPVELGTRLQSLPDRGLRVGGEGLLDVVHLDPLGRVAGLLEQPVDEDLEEVPGEVVGPLGVGPGHLVERALLASHEVSRDLADTELRPGPNHDKVSDGELVLVDRAAVHVVLDRLDGQS